MQGEIHQWRIIGINTGVFFHQVLLQIKGKSLGINADTILSEAHEKMSLQGSFGKLVKRRYVKIIGHNEIQTDRTGNLKIINPSAVLLDFPVCMIFLEERQEEDSYGEDKKRKTSELQK